MLRELIDPGHRETRLAGPPEFGPINVPDPLLSVAIIPMVLTGSSRVDSFFGCFWGSARIVPLQRLRSTNVAATTKTARHTRSGAGTHPEASLDRRDGRVNKRLHEKPRSRRVRLRTSWVQQAQL